MSKEYKPHPCYTVKKLNHALVQQLNLNLNNILPLAQVCCLYTIFNTIIQYQSLWTSFFTSFVRQSKELCESSSLFSEMMGNNNPVDFHKQITLLDFKKGQFNRTNNALIRSSTMDLHSEMTSVTFKSKTKKMLTIVRSWSKDGTT